jgi:SP family sugar:H+ symporter-like MFS transporter
MTLILYRPLSSGIADALLINVISGAVSIIACIITVLLVDKVGREPLLQWGSIGMAVSLALMVLAFVNADVGPTGDLDAGEWGPLALIAANAYVFTFNMSWGTVM